MNIEHQLYLARTIHDTASKHEEDFFDLLEKLLKEGQDFSTAIFNASKILREKGVKNG